MPRPWNQSDSFAQNAASPRGVDGPVFTVPAVPHDRGQQARAPVCGHRACNARKGPELAVGRQLCAGTGCRCRAGPRRGPRRRDWSRRRRPASSARRRPRRPRARSRRHGAPRRGQAREVGHDPPDTRSFGGGRGPHLGQPADHAVLDVDGGVVAAPAVGVHGRGHVVGDGAQGIRGGVDEAEEPRVRVAEGEGEDVLAHECDQLLRGPSLLGQRLVEEPRAVAYLAEDRPLEQPLAVRGHRVRGQPAQPPQLVGREVETYMASGL